MFWGGSRWWVQLFASGVGRGQPSNYGCFLAAVTLTVLPSFSATFSVGIPPGLIFCICGSVSVSSTCQGPSHPCGRFFTLVDAVSNGGQVKTESIAGVPSVLSEDQSGIDAAVEMAKRVDTVLLGLKSDQISLKMMHTWPEYSDELAGAE